MEKNKNLQENLDNSNEELHISGVMCSCDVCGEKYEEPEPVENFGEFNICPKCVNRTDVWLD